MHRVSLSCGMRVSQKGGHEGSLGDSGGSLHVEINLRNEVFTLENPMGLVHV